MGLEEAGLGQEVSPLQFSAQGPKEPWEKGGASHGLGPYEVQPCPWSQDWGILLAMWVHCLDVTFLRSLLEPPLLTPSLPNLSTSHLESCIFKFPHLPMPHPP